MRPSDEVRPDLVGDGHDSERLWTAEDVGRFLSVPPKSVYDLGIPRVRVGRRRIRWRPADVHEFIARRIED